jgi:hypothetical protein
MTQRRNSPIGAIVRTAHPDIKGQCGGTAAAGGLLRGIVHKFFAVARKLSV